MMRRLPLVVALVLAVSACQPGGDSSSPDNSPEDGTSAATSGTDGAVLRTAYQQDIGSFDPDNSFEVAALGAINAVYEGLVEYAPRSTDVVGLLAEDWDVSEDGLVYTFHLQDGVTFHDGSPMTAESVMASFERRQSDDLVLSYFLWNVTGMDAPDEQTFEVTLGMPQPSFLDNLASPWGPKVVGPEALVDNQGDDNSASYLDENADGTGPFRLTSFDRGQGYTLERFDDYWGEAPSFDAIDISVQPDMGQQILQLQRGELDLILHGYPFEQLADVGEGFEVTSYADLGLEMAYVNTSGVLADEGLRRAVRTAANPEAWVEEAFSGHAEPAASLFPRAMIAPSEPWEWPTDLEGASAAVSSAGSPEIRVAYTAEEGAVQQRVADLLVSQLSAVGFNATASAFPQDEVLTWAETPSEAPADLLLAQNNPDSAHPETITGLFYATGAPLNVFGYSNPDADEGFTAAGAITDPAERDAAYLDAARIVFEDGAFLPLADVEDVIVHRAGLANLDPRPAIPWNIDLATVKG